MLKHLIILFCCITFCMSKGKAQGQEKVGSKQISFICTPCGNPCDTFHFDGPGICPDCGMQLYAAYKGYENKEGSKNTQMQKNVAILVWPGVEIIDFAGPFEVFGAAGMNVYTVGEQQAQIETNMHLKIVPDYTFGNAPQPDILVIPTGRMGAWQ